MSSDQVAIPFSRRAFLSGAAAALPFIAEPARASSFVALDRRPGDPAIPGDPRRLGTALDKLVKRVIPALDLVNANTRETASVRFFGPDGYDVAALKDLDWFFRDWRQARAAPMDVRLYWALATMAQAARRDGHSGRITINSGYRSHATNDSLEGAARASMHLVGRAADFTVAGAPVDQVANYASFLGVGGVGYYPGRFVHIDTGGFRKWTRDSVRP